MFDRCKTKYPIVLIHGTGFRDNKILNYWGRIPKALTTEGADIYYGYQDCWGTIEYNASIIKNNILDVILKTGSEKVNLIAHSKGGLEARFMICELGMEQYIASLTTISTPHHSSKTIDKFYNYPTFLYKLIAFFVNLYFKILGDKSPDFYTASRQFSTYFCEKFNTKITNSEYIYYQSYASIMKNSFSDIFMAIPHFVVKLGEGDNDGLVTPNSAKWGEFKGLISGETARGISHADIVDFRRMGYSKIDIRGIYIGIVEDLKNNGF
ncbi:MAG: triacylglycerol lipase [Clostridium sp.]|jgi:triacylglycerol lipase